MDSEAARLERSPEDGREDTARGSEGFVVEDRPQQVGREGRGGRSVEGQRPEEDGEGLHRCPQGWGRDTWIKQTGRKLGRGT